LKHSTFAGVTGGLFLSMLDPIAVEARLICKDGYQLVGGSYIATPYCKDLQLVDRARRFGFNAPFAEIRNSPDAKRRLCAYVGRDPELRETCLSGGVGGND
jgi:hypothetical protein